MSLPGVSVVKNKIVCQCQRCRRHRSNPGGGMIPWQRKGQPTLVFSLGGSYGQRSLAGYSTYDCKELDMTEHAHMHMHELFLHALC